MSVWTNSVTVVTLPGSRGVKAVQPDAKGYAS